MPTIRSAALVLSALGLGLTARAWDISRQDQLAVYWGQNSYGATHTSDTANFQKNLSFYCQDSTIDVIPIAFVNVYFGTGGEPSINLANICNDVDDPTFSGTDLPNCQFMASDIQTCQAAGKSLLLSVGGATGAATFSSDAQGTEFANTIWNLFLGGSSDIRPFGSAVLDGVDLDIEGGSSTGYAAFVTQIRSLAAGASKRYYVTAAPQCPFPDAYLGSVINQVGMDALFVQFYNNYCGVNSYPTNFDFSDWDNWAKNTSPNKDVKVYVGAPAASMAANAGYYVDSGTLINIATTTRSQYSSFGGVMLWDASQAYVNNRYDVAIKNGIKQTGGSTTSKTTSTTSKTTTSTSKTSTTTIPVSTTSTTTSATSTTTASGGCAAAAAWSSTVAYTGGSQVTYNGHLWTAKWWSEGDVPGGAAGDWTDDGACSANGAKTAAATSSAVSKTGASPAKTSAAAEQTAPSKKSRFFRL